MKILKDILLKILVALIMYVLFPLSYVVRTIGALILSLGLLMRLKLGTAKRVLRDHFNGWFDASDFNTP